MAFSHFPRLCGILSQVWYLIALVPDPCPFLTLQDTFTQCLADSINNLCITLSCDTKNSPSVRLVIRLVGRKVGHKVGRSEGRSQGWSEARLVSR